MPKRRRRKGEAVSLFPFLSILACVIGVLTLMITALALGQMDTPDFERIERAHLFKRHSNQIEQDAKEVARLKKLLARAVALAEELKAAIRERDRLAADSKDTEAAEKRLAEVSRKLLAQSDRMLTRIKELEPEVAAVTKQISEMTAELAKRKVVPEASVNVIQPGGSGVGFVPTFIECRAEGVVTQGAGGGQRFRRADLKTDLEFIEILDQVAVSEKGKAVFLIRDDGWYTWRDAHNVATSRNCPNGQLPVVGQGVLDLSKFKP